MGRYWLVLLIMVGFSVQAVPPYQCRNGLFATYKSLQAGHIIGAKGEQIHARADDKGCPQGEHCALRGYLINGDPVLTAHPQQGWICIYYMNGNHDYTGWLPVSQVKLTALTTPPLSQWPGTWQAVTGNPQITITAEDDHTLSVTGDAEWYGGKTASGDDIVHLGSFAGHARPQGASATVIDGDGEYGSNKYVCQVKLQRVGRYLVATDNQSCGGMNVRFNGVYERQPTD